MLAQKVCAIAEHRGSARPAQGADHVCEPLHCVSDLRHVGHRDLGVKSAPTPEGFARISGGDSPAHAKPSALATVMT
jgi:hypothetical protein